MTLLYSCVLFGLILYIVTRKQNEKESCKEEYRKWYYRK
jgi:hypothetical protein